MVTSRVSSVVTDLDKLGLHVDDFAGIFQRHSHHEHEDAFKARAIRELRLDLLIDNRAGGIRKRLAPEERGLLKAWG